VEIPLELCESVLKFISGQNTLLMVKIQKTHPVLLQLALQLGEPFSTYTQELSCQSSSSHEFVESGMLANSWESIMTVRVQILEGKLHILIFVTLNVRFVV